MILNFALAFGFGFGFDKVFETWQKSVEADEATTETVGESAQQEPDEKKLRMSPEKNEERRDAIGNKK